LPHYLAFFRRDFHPWHHDNRYLIEKYGNSFSVYSMPEPGSMPKAEDSLQWQKSA
jgi:hypothetical protein